MISLPKTGDEWHEESLVQSKRMPRVRNGKYKAILAAHVPIAHILKMPCIYLARKPRWRQYPLVHQRNIVRILNHENLHHVLFDILGDKDGLDNIFPDLEDNL